MNMKKCVYIIINPVPMAHIAKGLAVALCYVAITAINHRYGAGHLGADFVAAIAVLMGFAQHIAHRIFIDRQNGCFESMTMRFTHAQLVAFGLDAARQIVKEATHQCQTDANAKKLKIAPKILSPRRSRSTLRQYSPPLAANIHPNLDDSPF